MSDLFEDNVEELIESIDDFEDIEVDSLPKKTTENTIDARRRLELMFEERSLRAELEDFDD